MSHSLYLSKLFQPNERKPLLSALDAWFKGSRNSYRVIGTGTSGIMVLGLLAGIRPNIALGVVRKKEEKNHSYLDVETTIRPEPTNLEGYVVIDDLVCSGATLGRIADSYGRPDLCKHVLLYESSPMGGSAKVHKHFPNATIWTIGMEGKFEEYA